MVTYVLHNVLTIIKLQFLFYFQRFIFKSKNNNKKYREIKYFLFQLKNDILIYIINLVFVCVCVYFFPYKYYFLSFLFFLSSSQFFVSNGDLSCHRLTFLCIDLLHRGILRTWALSLGSNRLLIRQSFLPMVVYCLVSISNKF